MKFLLKMVMFQLMVLMMLSSCETKKSCLYKYYAPSCESFNDRLYICDGTIRLPGCYRETICDNDGGVGNDGGSGAADTGGTSTENGDLTDAGVGCTEICVGSIVPCEDFSEYQCNYAQYCEWLSEDQLF